MISYDVLDENVLDDEETKAANIPEKDNVAVENGNVIQPAEEDTEIANKVGVKDAIDFLGNNKLGYNIWDTIVKGV